MTQCLLPVLKFIQSIRQHKLIFPGQPGKSHSTATYLPYHHTVSAIQHTAAAIVPTDDTAAVLIPMTEHHILTCSDNILHTVKFVYILT